MQQLVTWYFFSTVFVAVILFKKRAVFGTVITYLTVLLDISVTVLKWILNARTENFL